MPAAVAPVLHYVLHDNFTPAQRAQLTKSHKKVEQLLGVTPSLRPVQPAVPEVHHQRSRSFTVKLAVAPVRTKAQARERGKLSGLFGVDFGSNKIEENSEAILHRVSTDSSYSSSSSSSSASSSTNSLPDLISTGACANFKRRPPPLQLVVSNFGKQERVEDEKVLDITASRVSTDSVGKTTVLENESPLSPLFKVNLPREKSRASILEEMEWNKIAQGVSNLPISHKEKARKLNRLGKMFGVLPPLEMVFPPSPTSRSRFDPKRYTLELPPPLLRGTFTDDLSEKTHRAPELVNNFATLSDEKVMRVEWDNVNDEAGRKKVMDALRSLH